MPRSSSFENSPLILVTRPLPLLGGVSQWKPSTQKVLWEVTETEYPAYLDTSECHKQTQDIVGSLKDSEDSKISHHSLQTTFLPHTEKHLSLFLPYTWKHLYLFYQITTKDAHVTTSALHSQSVNIWSKNTINIWLLEYYHFINNLKSWLLNMISMGHSNWARSEQVSRSKTGLWCTKMVKACR